MHMTVDQARKNGRGAKIDDARSRHIDKAVAYFGDGPPADDDAGIASWRFAWFDMEGAGVDYGDGFGLDLRGERSGRGKRERNETISEREAP